MLVIHNCDACKHLTSRSRIEWLDCEPICHGQQVCGRDSRISDNLRYFPFTCEKTCCEPKGE